MMSLAHELSSGWLFAIGLVIFVARSAGCSHIFELNGV